LYVIVIYVRCGQRGLAARVRTHWTGLDSTKAYYTLQ